MEKKKPKHKSGKKSQKLFRPELFVDDSNSDREEGQPDDDVRRAASANVIKSSSNIYYGRSVGYASSSLGANFS